MARNDRYWGGKPHLDGLKFQYSAGGTQTLQTFQSGQSQAAVLSDPAPVADAIKQNIPHFTTTYLLAEAIFMNGAPLNQPGGSIISNATLRKAIAMAIDPEIYNERVNQGKAKASSLLFPKGTKWYDPGAAGPTHDPKQAKALVDKVKQETGWNGKLRYLCTDLPNQVNAPVAIQSMLAPIGINLDIKQLSGNAFIQALYIKREFDLGCGNAGVDENVLWPMLNPVLYWPGSNNTSHYDDPKMNAALDQLRVAVTQDQKAAAVKQIAQIWDQTNPMVPLSADQALVIYSTKVHGLVQNMNAGVLFDKAWISR
jgi:peptide/nickel transport system substrate-binding protein